MKILLTNDDGINAVGLKALRQALTGLGEICVVAPEEEQSASSHGITLRKPVVVKNPEQGIYTVSGTPTDCIVLALRAGLCPDPDIVLSGINSGYNIGEDILYSGTFAAAAEASLSDIPSMAVSSEYSKDISSFEKCGKIARKLIPAVLELGGLWNLNVPSRLLSEKIKVTFMGHRKYDRAISPRFDPIGRAYYWLSGDKPLWDVEEGSDISAVESGAASLTPYKIKNLLDVDLAEKIKVLLEKDTK
ncbi:5'/3'-nucleotidase SurE [candidate division WOR-3 bacterium]|nr:5'/3'-nucleotidase SurE [candidate division WOR-3 bacterium]